ncbi:5-deoxy-glucuronate isomerase [Paenibacillus alginolyticus]|uniref:5-deoxy-glucuronate isomerase n=1 Tax=Paenibacillus alginolyticus TaxID=59839 RepID=UPI000686951A|nr:5-deoxy-glucuronate isomerase [Paenibacillus alginolyticus]MEC0146448.1 5-deoxy-glucuronate isomerase [Paenibacillus alginolyticus]
MESKGVVKLSHLFKENVVKGYQDIIQEHQDLKYLAFGKISLNEGEEFTRITGDFETTLVILSGKASISCENEKWSHLGERNNVFEGKATAVYMPCQSEYQVIAQTNNVQIAVCKVKAENKFRPFVVRPNDIIVNQRGKDTWQREVHDIIADNGNNRVQRIILGETFNDVGHWSSYPPHKHDGEFYPEEPNLEEVYHYQIDPDQGFGVQLYYTKDQSIDQAYIVKNGDSFAIEKGYHPVSAAGGYRLYYLWFMAGETDRNLKPFDDPDHKWLK